MLTKRDKQELLAEFKQVFATKEELSQMTEYLTHTFISKFDIMMGEFKAIREELAAMNYRSAEHSDSLEDHEQRIGRLETTKPTP